MMPNFGASLQLVPFSYIGASLQLVPFSVLSDLQSERKNKDNLVYKASYKLAKIKGTSCKLAPKLGIISLYLNEIYEDSQ